MTAHYLAEEWYVENEQFRSLVNSSVDLVRRPTLSNSQTVATEYVVRAHTVLYLVENLGGDPIFLLLAEAKRDFPDHFFYMTAMLTKRLNYYNEVLIDFNRESLFKYIVIIRITPPE